MVVAVVGLVLWVPGPGAGAGGCGGGEDGGSDGVRMKAVTPTMMQKMTVMYCDADFYEDGDGDGAGGGYGTRTRPRVTMPVVMTTMVLAQSRGVCRDGHDGI